MYYRPECIDEAMPLLKKGTMIAGGTDLFPLIKDQVRDFSNLIEVSRLPELQGIQFTETGCRIGAAVLLTVIAHDPEIQRVYPALAQAASVTASPQIRNQGTIGGNIMQDRRCIYFNQSAYWRSSFDKCFKTGGKICHQIPNSPDCCAIYYSDVAPALYLYQAVVIFHKGAETLRLPIQDFVEEHIRCNGLVMPRDILVEAFELPLPATETISAFHKTALRTTVDFPLIHFAAGIDGDTHSLRIIAGAINRAPIPVESVTAAWDQAEGYLSVDELTDLTVAELKKKGRPVKEAAISISVKRSAYTHVRFVLEKLGLH